MRKCYRRVTLTVITVLGLIYIAGCGSGITMKNYNTAEEQFAHSMEAYQSRHYLKAIDGFQKVVYNFSGASIVDSAQYYMAMAYYQDKEYFLAASEFERLVNNYPGSQFVDDAQYMSGLCYFKSSPKHYGLDQEELLKAIDLLNDFITDNPSSELVPDARETIRLGQERLARKEFESGRMYFRLSNYPSAKIYFQAVIDEYTATEYAGRSLFYLADIEYKTKKYDDAKQKFQSFLVIYPEHELAEKARNKIAEIDKKFAKAENN